MNAPQSIPVLTAAGSASIAVGLGLTVYTHSIDLANLDTFALSYKVTCTGVPNMKIEMEQSVVLPTTEGAADGNWVVPETIADIVTALITKTVHVQAIFPVCTRYIRFKIKDTAAAVGDNVFTMNLSAQNRFIQ